MSTEPDDWIGEVGHAEVLAEAVEQHLDHHPFPVDDDEVARVAARLHQRIAPPRTGLGTKLLAGLTLVAAAAAVLLWFPQLVSETSTAPTVSDPAAVLQADTDSLRVVSVPAIQAVAGRPLTTSDSTVLFSSEQGEAGVLLVSEGNASLGGTDVPEDHWAVVTSSDAPVLVFPDGMAPPADLPDVVEEQLDDVRWRALPPRTLEALDRLMEAP